MSGVVNPEPKHDSPWPASSNETESTEAKPVFNEQTNYVPKSTIITVRVHIEKKKIGRESWLI